MSRKKSEQVSAAKIAAWGGIAVAVIAAFGTIIVAIINKPQKVDATPANNSYSANQNNSNARASVPGAENANRNLQQNSNVNRFTESRETNNNSSNDKITNMPEQSKSLTLAQIGQEASPKDFVFRLNSCTQIGTNLTCQFSIMNESTADRELRLYVDHGNHESKIIDVGGEEYIATRGKIGNKEGGGFVDFLLLPKVPMKALIEFKMTSTELPKIKRLRLECSSYDSNGRWQSYWYADF